MATAEEKVTLVLEKLSDSDLRTLGHYGFSEDLRYRAVEELYERLRAARTGEEGDGG